MSDALRLPDTVHTIPDALTYWAAQTPGAPAIHAIDGRVLSHSALQVAVLDVGARLSERGIGRHDRVALVLPGGADTATALLGIMSVAIAAPFHPGSTGHELARDLARLQPALLVTDGAFESPSRMAAGELGIPATSLAELLAPGDTNAVRPPCSSATEPEDIAAILHTSGTTGAPKRVLRSHRSFVAAARAARLCTALTPGDVALLTSGLSTNSGLANLCAALLNGGSCVVTPGFDPAAYPRWLETYQPTWAVSTSTELTMLLAAVTAAGCETIAGPRSRLRVVRAGAQPMAPGVAERAEHSLRALICDGYGMTEASYITGSGLGPGDRRPGSVGPPLCSTIRILDANGADLPAGETGEIVIRGATLFSGYLDDPEVNAAVFLPGGWFRTGDLGFLDGDGYLFVHGRLHELINRGGEKIAPIEVDHAFLAHPAVADAATFAVPDPRLGEDIVAAVVLEPGRRATRRQLRAWLLDRLNRYKAPRRIWLVESIPRTPTGKVQRGVLAQRWREQER